MLARRIVFYPKVGDRLERGQRVGLIKFGSRVDVVLDASARVNVKVGDRVKGGASVLAYLQPQGALAAAGSASASREGALMDQCHRRGRGAGMSKGMYILPSLFTTANMALGYYAILEVMHATADEYWHLDNAAKAIGFAVLFDGLDGRIARMTGTSSDFGRELDSLADAITFGVAPAMLAWTWGFHLMPPVLLTRRPLAHQADATGRDCQLSFPDCGSEPPGALQHYQQSAAFESRASGQEIFRRHADSRGSGRDCGGRAFRGRRSAGVVVHGAGLVRHGDDGRLSDGEHVALLQLQGHRFPLAPSVPADSFCWRRCLRLIFVLLAARCFLSIALIYMISGVFWRLQWIFRRRSDPPPPPYKEASQAS